MKLTTVKIESTECYWDNFLSEDEITHIIEYCDKFEKSTAKIFKNEEVQEIRKSNIAFIFRDSENEWFFNKIEICVNKLNTKLFGFDIHRLETLQYTLYDEEGSHYDWHWDMFESRNITDVELYEQRKVTAVLQLSDPEDYEGGELEISPCGKNKFITKKKGYLSVFPTFLLHRVTPVTKGKRKTLVAWFTGPDWR